MSVFTSCVALTPLMPGLQSEETKSTDGMEKLSSQMSRVNGSVTHLDGRVRDHSATMQGNLEEVKGDVSTLKIKVTAFESHPPTIGEVQCKCTCYIHKNVNDNERCKTKE